MFILLTIRNDQDAVLKILLNTEHILEVGPSKFIGETVVYANSTVGLRAYRVQENMESMIKLLNPPGLKIM